MHCKQSEQWLTVPPPLHWRRPCIRLGIWPYAEVLNPVWDVCSARLDKTLFKLLSNSLLWVYLAKLHMYLSSALQIAAWKVMIINRRTIICQIKGHESFPVAKSIFVSNVFMVVRQYCRGSCITIYPAKPFLHWRLLYATEMPIYGSEILFNSNSLYWPKITDQRDASQDQRDTSPRLVPLGHDPGSPASLPPDVNSPSCVNFGMSSLNAQASVSPVLSPMHYSVGNSFPP